MDADAAAGEDDDAGVVPISGALSGWRERSVDLILARHGSTPWTRPYRRYQGRTDVQLSPRGRLEAEQLAEALAGRSIASIWHSPLARARDTAEAVARRLGVPMRGDDRLIELSFGEWEGRSHADVRRSSPDLVRRRSEDVLGFAPLGGERIGTLLERVGDFLSDRSNDGARPQLVVAHEGIARAAAVCLGLLDVADFYALDVPCGGAIEVRARPGGVCKLGVIAAPDGVLDPLRSPLGPVATEDGEVA